VDEIYVILFYSILGLILLFNDARIIDAYSIDSGVIDAHVIGAQRHMQLLSILTH
jgi:hypothetical protein